MGKDMTPKEISKMIKAKGLQRLRWYCQFCQKQCRDENGFKCHQASEGHLRQMELVSHNSSMFVDNFSKEFEADFLKVLSRRYPTATVSANHVYNEFIKDRNHVHMNATQWSSLSEFVKYLGRESKCVVEETPKGWMITYINREADSKKERESRREKVELTEDERQRLEIEKRLKHLNALDEKKVVVPTEITPTDSKLVLQINPIKPVESTISQPSFTNNNVFQSFSLNNNIKMNIGSSSSNSNSSSTNSNNIKKSALDEIMEKDIKLSMKPKDITIKHETDKKESWIAKNIIVKIMEKDVGNERFYKQKAIVVDLESEYVAKVKTLEDNVELKIDQSFLETVIPSISSQVLILRGRYRGKVATLMEIDMDKFSGTVQLLAPTDSKTSSSSSKSFITITDIPYEDFCKYTNNNSSNN